MCCLVLVAVCSLGADDRDGPPVRGRPEGFSGIEGSVEISASATPTELTAESPLTYTLRLKGPATLATLPVPELQKLRRFDEHFAIRLLSQQWLAQEGTREFQFELRPRNANVGAIPPFSFSFWLRGKVPPEKGYQTRSTRTIPLKVTNRAAPSVHSIPIEGAPEAVAADELTFDFSPDTLVPLAVPATLPVGLLAVIALAPPVLVLLFIFTGRTPRRIAGRGCKRILEMANRLARLDALSPTIEADARHILDATPEIRLEGERPEMHVANCGCGKLMATCRRYVYGGDQTELLSELIGCAKEFVSTSQKE
jgi:hypothetical protein